MQTSTANGDGLAINDLAFLYPRELKPGQTRPDFERSFFMLPPGSDVPPRYPNQAPPRTLWDLIVSYLFDHELPALALVGRSMCHAVRKRRFRILRLHPHMNHARLVEILRPDTTLPFVRQLTVNGRLSHPGMITDGEADHRWLNEPSLVQLIADLCTHSPIEFLFLQSLSWGDICVEVRTALRSQSMRGVRALMIHDVDFWTSNQYLMTLNAYPHLQFLSVWHANFHALTHVPAQLQRTEPLLLTELVAGCSYTGLLMEWLLGRREMLAIEEMTLDCKDMYRDDARLARVLRKVSPWLKRFYYMEWQSRGTEGCEGECHGLLVDPEELENSPPTPWAPPPRTSRDGGAPEGDDEDAELMDVDYVDSSDVMDEDSEADANMSSTGAVSSRNQANLATGSAESPPVSYRPVNWPKLLMPDDEGRNEFKDCSSDLSCPPFSSTEERGYNAFANELARRIDTPMLEAIDARINWTSVFSLLTLKMLCQLTYTYKGFYRFEVRIVFASPELFESAPWKTIDSLLARASRRLPGGVERDVPGDDQDEEEDEDDEEHDLSLSVSVNGWDVDGREGRARTRDLRRNLPRTTAENVLAVELEDYWHASPRWAPSRMPE